MCFKQSIRENPIAWLGIFLATGLILSTTIGASTAYKMKQYSNETVQVTGYASKIIESDFVSWRLSFSNYGSSLADAYSYNKQDKKIVKAHLLSQDIQDKELTELPLTTETIYARDDRGNYSNRIEGFTVTQHIKIDSHDVDNITTLSKEVSELINKGVTLTSNPPEYFASKLDEVKIEVLSKATENAKMRATNMLKNTGNSVGSIRSASMGVFQITPVNSTEVSDYGVNDTSSREKRVTAVVSVSYSIR